MMTSEECTVILISSLLLWDLGAPLIPFSTILLLKMTGISLVSLLTLCVLYYSNCNIFNVVRHYNKVRDAGRLEKLGVQPTVQIYFFSGQKLHQISYARNEGTKNWDVHSPTA